MDGPDHGWVYRHPARVVVGLMALVIPVASGMTRLTYESNYINAFKPETRVVRDYQAIESRLGGIGVVELIVPSSGPITSKRAWSNSGRWNGACVEGSSPGPRASYVLSLATVLDPDRRISALPEPSASRILATKLGLIAASPQAELLRRIPEPRSQEARILVRLVEQQPAPDKSAIFARASGLSREAFGRIRT